MTPDREAERTHEAGGARRRHAGTRRKLAAETMRTSRTDDAAPGNGARDGKLKEEATGLLDAVRGQVDTSA